MDEEQRWTFAHAIAKVMDAIPRENEEAHEAIKYLAEHIGRLQDKAEKLDELNEHFQDWQ